MTAARRRGGTWPVLLAATAALGACGQRGDLYLPASQKSAVPAVTGIHEVTPPDVAHPGLQFARLPQASLHYQLTGNGPRTLVLLHELGTSLETWDSVMPELTRNHRVLRYDLRGFGRSDRIRGSIRMEDEVADLAGLLDSLDIREPVTLVGGAVGAAVALRFAADHPQRARAVLAISPSTGVAPANRAANFANADLLESIGTRAFVDGRFGDIYPAVLQAGHDDRVARFRALQYANDPASMAATLRMITVSEWDAVWPRIQCPTWIVAPRLFAARPVTTLQAIADAIPNGRGHLEVAETGQFMAIQSPELLSPLLQRFLSQP